MAMFSINKIIGGKVGITDFNGNSEAIEISMWKPWYNSPGRATHYGSELRSKGAIELAYRLLHPPTNNKWFVINNENPELRLRDWTGITVEDKDIQLGVLSWTGDSIFKPKKIGEVDSFHYDHCTYLNKKEAKELAGILMFWASQKLIKFRREKIKKTAIVPDLDKEGVQYHIFLNEVQTEVEKVYATRYDCVRTAA